jgi:dipeptidyl-peptidase-4
MIDYSFFFFLHSFSKRKLMNFFRSLLLLLLLANTILCAQTKMLTMEEAVIKQKTSLAPDKLNIAWIPGSKGFSFTSKDRADELMLCYGPASKPELLMTRTKLNGLIKASGNDTLKTFPSVSWSDITHFSFSQSNRTFYFGMHEEGLRVVTETNTETEENKDEAPGGKFKAFTIENNLFISKDKDLIQVTKDVDKNIVNGHSVHREEFGITKGTFWSPNGTLLAFYRMDQTMVTDYPVLDLTTRPAIVDMIKYPMAGDKSHEVTVGIFDPLKRSTVFLKTGLPKEQYLTNIAWSPDEKHIYIAVLNRDQNHLWMNEYNALTGDFEKTLFEEQDEKYVQPLHPLEFVRSKPGLFVWQSKRNGFNNIYLYTTEGKLVRQLTGLDGTDNEVSEFYGFDAKGEHAIYQCATKNNLIGRVIRSVSLKDGKTLTLRSGKGTHAARLSPDGTYLIDTWSATDVPRMVVVMGTEGKMMQTLLNAPNPLSDYKLGTMRLFSLPASDGTPLFCRMILPINFDSTKKYPVIDYLYGGPGVQLVSDSWLAGSDLWYEYMAEHGYIVFTLDNRGSSGRGKTFEQTTFRRLGNFEMEDQIKGTDFLKSLPYVDKSRLGVFGWSFGGFMTTSLMTRHAGLFKAAVAGGPVIDWSYYEVMYTERYMDTPQTNKEGYAESSLLHYAGKLQGKLLIIHGTSDDVVVWQHSLLFLKKCVDAGTQPDYFVYPGHLHNVLGKDRVHLFTKITAYFEQNL